jgi:hypothetical protein
VLVASTSRQVMLGADVVQLHLANALWGPLSVLMSPACTCVVNGCVCVWRDCTCLCLRELDWRVERCKRQTHAISLV